MGHYECRRCDQRYDKCTCPPVTLGKPKLPRKADGSLDLPCGCGHGWNMHNQYGCYERDGGIAGHDTYCSCGNQPPQMVADEKEARRLKRLKICSKHPRYLIRTQPKSACAACWKAWFEVEGK